MKYEMRPVTVEEFPTFSRTIGSVFGEPMNDEEIAAQLTTTELDRTLAVFDEGKIVGTAGIDSFTLTVPGPATLPAAGITAITVLPTHRRQGLLTAIMAQQLVDIEARGEPLAILQASESLIYGRFGYGLASTQVNYEIEPYRADFAVCPKGGGTLRLVDGDTAATIMPDVYDRARLVQPGAITRKAQWWQRWLTDPPSWRGGASSRYYVVYQSESGEYEGYANYRIKGDWKDNFPNNTMLLTQLIATTAPARAALWRFAFSLDLTARVQALNFSAQEPVRWMLKDPRRMRATQSADFLWICIVDVAAALGGRRYSVADRLIFEVEDEFRPGTSGRYALHGGPTDAACTRTTDAPDIALSIADLGATYLGGVGFTTLAHAGRVRELTPGALRRADVLFSSEPLPWCCTPF